MAEMTKHRAPAPRQAVAHPVPVGFVGCGSCGEPTLPADLYQSEDGEVCHQCNAAEESADTLSRGERDQAMTQIFMPIYVSMVMAIIYPFIHFINAHPAFWTGLIALVGAFSGAAAVRTAIRARDSEWGDRLWLGTAGLWSMSILLGFAVVLIGVV